MQRISAQSEQRAALVVYCKLKQCCKILKKLKQDDKKMKDHNAWCDMQDSILGHGPVYAGNVATKDTAA